MKKQEFLSTVISYSAGMNQTIRSDDRLWVFSEGIFSFRKILGTVLVFLIAVYIFGFKYLPLQDYPNWLYQGFLFKEYLVHGQMLNGFFHFYSYIPPNAISTIFIGCLSVVLSPFIAGKIFLFVAALLLYFGAESYLSLFIKNRPIFNSCIAFYLVFNLNFLMGFINYSFGMGFALLILSYLVRNELSVNRISFSMLLVMLYLSHFSAFAIVPVFLAVYAYHTKRYKESLLLLPAFLPAIILFMEYFLTKSISDLPIIPETESVFGHIHMIFHSVFSVIIPFHHYKWVSEPGFISKGLNYLFSIASTLFILYIFFCAWKKRVRTLALRLSLTLMVIILIIPNYFGGVMFPATRLVIIFMLNIIVLYFSEERSVQIRRISTVIAIVLATSSFLYNMMNANNFDEQMITEVIPRDAIMQPTFALEGTDGFMHIIFYHGIIHHEALRTFQSGFFTYPEERKGDSFGNK
jgi:hypothetical protein